VSRSAGARHRSGAIASRPRGCSTPEPIVKDDNRKHCFTLIAPRWWAILVIVMARTDLSAPSRTELNGRRVLVPGLALEILAAGRRLHCDLCADRVKPLGRMS
jgi:hypothetical protein